MSFFRNVMLCWNWIVLMRSASVERRSVLGLCRFWRRKASRNFSSLPPIVYVVPHRELILFGLPIHTMGALPFLDWNNLNVTVYVLVGLYGCILLIPALQLFRIYLRAPELGWTTQKLFLFLTLISSLSMYCHSNMYYIVPHMLIFHV